MVLKTFKKLTKTKGRTIENDLVDGIKHTSHYTKCGGQPLRQAPVISASFTLSWNLSLNVDCV